MKRCVALVLPSVWPTSSSLSVSSLIAPLRRASSSSSSRSSNDNLQTSTSFVEGSRTAVYRWHRSPPTAKAPQCRRGDYCDVHVVPMAHAATREFYDYVLRYIHAISVDLDGRDANPAVPITTPVTPPEGLLGLSKSAAKGAPQQQQGSSSTSTSSSSTTTAAEKYIPNVHLKVVLEGVCDDVYQRDVEQSEWDLLAKRLASDDPEDQDATTVFEHLVGQGKLFKEETQRDIATMAQLPFPVPGGLELQEAYWVPLLASRFASTLVSGDVVISRLEQEYPDGAWKLNAKCFHEWRELQCVHTVRKLAERDDVHTIVVPWGHFHVPRIVKALLAAPAPGIRDETFLRPGGPLLSAEPSSHSFEALAADSKAGSSGVWRAVGAQSTPREYGWTLQLLKDVYNIEMPLFDNAVKHAESVPASTSAPAEPVR